MRAVFNSCFFSSMVVRVVGLDGGLDGVDGG